MPNNSSPTTHIYEGDFIISTQQMASVQTIILSEPLTELSKFIDEIIAAIDFLITGI